MKAKMKDNLIMRYQLAPELDYRDRFACSHIGHFNELIAVKKISGFMEYFKLKQFLKSIEGSEVELVFTAGDAFEKNDNNVWLPESLWDPIK